MSQFWSHPTFFRYISLGQVTDYLQIRYEGGGMCFGSSSHLYIVFSWCHPQIRGGTQRMLWEKVKGRSAFLPTSLTSSLASLEPVKSLELDYEMKDHKVCHFIIAYLRFIKFETFIGRVKSCFKNVPSGDLALLLEAIWKWAFSLYVPTKSLLFHFLPRACSWSYKKSYIELDSSSGLAESLKMMQDKKPNQTTA